jgi:hypothetical protein
MSTTIKKCFSMLGLEWNMGGWHRRLACTHVRAKGFSPLLLLVMLSFVITAPVYAQTATTTVPHTFKAGDDASADQVNANFKALADGVNGVKSEIEEIKKRGPVAGQATTYKELATNSTSWIDMADMRVVLTTNGNPVIMHFTTQATNEGGIVGFRFAIDGNEVTSAPFGNAMMENTTTQGYQQNVVAGWLAKGLSAGEHTFKVQWRVSGGTGYAPESAGGTQESDRTLIVYELK